MHRTLENDCVGNTWVTQRVHCFFISGGMWTGPRMGNQPCKLKLTPLARDEILIKAAPFSPLYKFQSGTPYYFRDMTTDTRISIGGGYRLDMLQPLTEFSHVVFGSESNDPIFGQGKND